MDDLNRAFATKEVTYLENLVSQLTPPYLRARGTALCTHAMVHGRRLRGGWLSAASPSIDYVHPRELLCRSANLVDLYFLVGFFCANNRLHPACDCLFRRDCRAGTCARRFCHNLPIAECTRPVVHIISLLGRAYCHLNRK